MNAFETFTQLHKGPTPLLLGNIWDVNSARVFKASGYKAIGTSSLAVARASGYEDGEQLPFEVLLQLAKRVTASVQIPFSVDLEAGYSRTPAGITGNIDKLHDAGVVGINIEDTIAGGTSQLQSIPVFQKILSAVADHISRNNLKIFVNVRTDGFLLGMPTALPETLARIKSYDSTGVDGIFVPCIVDSNDIKEVVKATHLPINVMCTPGLPDFEELGGLGVKRISMGSFFFDKVYDAASTLSKAIAGDKCFSPILT
ncbi:MAG TPA: isocitrate lyase/phosphoenolpyruvate mutase family protein [Puia sp.]|nr:isocitrate lyase/phosphoenolpyruvate mutase family protein [Puia sp.]